MWFVWRNGRLGACILGMELILERIVEGGSLAHRLGREHEDVVLFAKYHDWSG